MVEVKVIGEKKDLSSVPLKTKKKKNCWQRKKKSFEEEKKRWKKAKLLDNLKQNDFQMKCTNVNVYKIHK